MKIWIHYTIQQGPYGGANQFLRALSLDFAKNGVLADSPDQADVILLNSFHDIAGIPGIFEKIRSKVFVHRIDGPDVLRDWTLGARDDLVRVVNEVFADATIFQSEWSRLENLKRGIGRSSFQVRVWNAPDGAIFHGEGRTVFPHDGKIRLVAVSWSSNKNKGFSEYAWIDKHLDFSRFEVTFIGNSPIRFRNIRMLAPVGSHALAGILRTQDIYLTATRNETCSNALIEAMQCGLPVLALKSGAVPEIAGDAGEFFTNAREIPAALERIVMGYSRYQTAIRPYAITQASGQYLEFIKEVHQAVTSGKYPVKTRTTKDLDRINRILKFYNLNEIVNKCLFSRIKKMFVQAGF